MMNIKIRGIAVKHGQNLMYADHYIEHFKKQGKDIKRLLESYGREQYYLAEPEQENTLMLGYEATRALLEQEGLTGQDLDMIVFCSQCPEYLIPSQATILHGLIEGNIKAQVMDINVNCAGMLTAFDSAVRIMQTRTKMNRVLIVGAECLSFIANEQDEYTYPIVGDAGCAVILEKTEDTTSGFIESTYRTNGKTWELVTYPPKGFVADRKDTKQKGYIKWTPFDADFVAAYVKESLMEVLEQTDYTVEDISLVCPSQYARGMVENCSQALDIPMEKFMYIGDEYGYTGTSSTFIALYEAIQAKRIKRGDLVNLWTVGTHWTIINMLIKY